MSPIRPPAVAGTFYPADAAELRVMVTELIAQARNPGPAPKALVAPHAGYIYSGLTAAHAYARLRSAAAGITRVVLAGPAHRVPFRGIACSAAEGFHTPLGDVPLDRDALEKIRDLPQIRTFDAAHAQEHSLETHLPFLQIVLERFWLAPLVVGDATPEQVAEVLERLWGGPETLIVVSSDLSHYHDYDSARRLDAVTSEAIIAGRPEKIGYDSACGAIPLKGLMHAAERHELRTRLLDLRNSGDTAGDRRRVVGYGAYAFE